MCKAMQLSKESIVHCMRIPGFGAEKYVEVNRIMAKRAREHGGCMVARSQMHAIVERDPLLDRTVEKKYYIYCLQIFICGVISTFAFFCSGNPKTCELKKYQRIMRTIFPSLKIMQVSMNQDQDKRKLSH